MRPVSVSRFLVTKGTQKSGCKVAKNENWDLSVVLDKDSAVHLTTSFFTLLSTTLYNSSRHFCSERTVRKVSTVIERWKRERARSSKQFVFCWQHQLHCALCFLVVVRNAFNSTEQNLWVDEKAPTHLSWGSRKKSSSHRSIYFELSKAGQIKEMIKLPQTSLLFPT